MYSTTLTPTFGRRLYVVVYNTRTSVAHYDPTLWSFCSEYVCRINNDNYSDLPIPVSEYYQPNFSKLT